MFTDPVKDLSNGHLAFKYESTTETAITWEITDIDIIKCSKANAVESVVINNPSITVNNGIITVNAMEGSVEVFNVIGQKIFSAPANGVQTIEGLKKGQIYIIRQGNKTTKIVL